MKFLKIIILLSILACDNGNNQIFEKINFKVNNQILTKNYNFDNRSFNMKFPQNVSLINDSVLHQLKTNIDNDTSGIFQLNFLSAFQSEIGLSILLCKIKGGSNFFNTLDNQYINSLKLVFETEEIHVGQYLHNNIKFKQYTIIAQELVLIKLFFSVNNNFYQLDYMIPKNLYKELLEQLESSIGSIHK